MGKLTGIERGHVTSTTPTRGAALEDSENVREAEWQSGLEDGSYANAYNDSSLERALRGLYDRTGAYLSSFVLGWLGTYEVQEMSGDERARLYAALAYAEQHGLRDNRDVWRDVSGILYCADCAQEEMQLASNEFRPEPEFAYRAVGRTCNGCGCNLP